MVSAEITDIFKLMTDNSRLCTLTANVQGNPLEVTAYCESAPGLEGSATYSSGMEQMSTGINGADNIQRMVNSAASFTNQLAGNTLNITDTVEYWTSGSFGSQTLNLIFYTYSSNINVITEVKKCMRFVVPVSKGGLELDAPLGYKSKGGDSVSFIPKGARKYINSIGGLPSSEGTITLQIGQWFLAPSAFICDKVSVEFSKTVVYDNKNVIHRPLYAKVNISLKPWRLFLWEEVESWYIETV